MTNPCEIYDLLQDYAGAPVPVGTVVIGLVWTLCEADAVGLSMSPGVQTRTLPWAGTLRGKTLSELVAWVREFDPYRATVGMAAVNAGINRLGRLPDGVTLAPKDGAENNLAVFEHFLGEMRGKRVVVIGRYPGLDRFAHAHALNLTVLERQPGPDDLPDSACEYLVPEADWVFLTATSIPNKTFPRLAALARDATTVLMGPTVPWLPELRHFGIDYLAGVEIVDTEVLRDTVCEGGGVRIFDAGVRYRIAPIGPESTKAWARHMIAQATAERERLKKDMEAWYGRGNAARFPQYAQLEAVDRRLSRLDTCFKRLWDASPDP
ncbi:conserved hypothetical protein [Methylococcus capsulatus str. Bath]|uniref:Heavy-metal chelation domain-containing protein n=1 Tax=Methylococcus capsulatus (strain ATCC 33009 / NCIMB 11132 / Bath) TaxID=243233 RepID=Q603H2_METCA|nr:DUF364 domain-containing protein [Methylococcus capsulatus]AAU91016.1 conserved hypothetical protein [Methylococcus capsulatus str. Bath]